MCDGVVNKLAKLEAGQELTDISLGRSHQDRRDELQKCRGKISSHLQSVSRHMEDFSRQLVASTVAEYQYLLNEGLLFC